MSRDGRIIFNCFFFWCIVIVFESVAVIVFNNLEVVKENVNHLPAFAFTRETLQMWADAYLTVKKEIGSVMDVIFTIAVLLMFLGFALGIRILFVISQEKFLDGENIVLACFLLAIIILSGVLAILFSTPFMLMIFAAILVGLGAYSLGKLCPVKP